MSKLKILVTVCLLLFNWSAFTPCFASELGYRLDKAVNGDWQHSYLVNFELGTQYQAYLNTAAVFLAPRSTPMQANHDHFAVTVGGKVNVLGWDLRGETGTWYMWAGNNQGLPEGFNEWANAVSLTHKF